jgi:N-acylneuraminate cytidylyltransferase
MERRPFFGSRTRFIELPRWRGQDVDTEDDWQMAEQLFAAMRARSE